MVDWTHENIAVDTIRTNNTQFAVEIRGQTFILSEREADALAGELSMHGAKNPNKGSRYRKSERSDNRSKVVGGDE